MNYLRWGRGCSSARGLGPLSLRFVPRVCVCVCTRVCGVSSPGALAAEDGAPGTVESFSTSPARELCQQSPSKTVGGLAGASGEERRAHAALGSSFHWQLSSGFSLH